MTSVTLSRQFATGIAAFLVTALLILANAPADRGVSNLRLGLADTSLEVPASPVGRG